MVVRALTRTGGSNPPRSARLFLSFRQEHFIFIALRFLGSTPNIFGSTPNIVENVFLRDVEVTAFDEDTQAVVLEVAEAIRASLDELHLAMEAFRDSVVAREAPHADDGGKPCAQRVSQRAPGFMCCMGELVDHFSEFLERFLTCSFCECFDVE